MLKLNPEFLIKNNKKQFAILPYEQFIKIKECLEDLKDLMKKIKQSHQLSSKLIKIVGGPRMTHAIATKLGFDAGFGAGTLPSDVASFIASRLND